jgi:CheY-like chemotaxis protein
VKLYLPRHIGAGEAAPAAQSAPQHRAEPASILLVEDDEEVRTFIAESLRRLGHRVLAVGDGAEALAVVTSAEPIDLLLTDVGLPGMSGREVADRALALRPSLKVLFTSGYTRNAIVHGGRLDPGVLLLPKPFTTDFLAQKVAEALSRRSS